MKLAIHSVSLIYNFMQSKAVDDKETHRLFFFSPCLALFWSAIVQSCIVCCKTESHLPFVSTKHLDMKVSLLSKQRISAQPPETQEMHKGPFLSPILYQHPSCHTITLRFINYSNPTWARASADNSKSVFTNQRQNMAWDFWLPCGNISLWLNLHIYAILLILLYLPFIHYYYIHRSISQLFKLILNNTLSISLYVHSHPSIPDLFSNAADFTRVMNLLRIFCTIYSRCSDVTLKKKIQNTKRKKEKK